MSIGNIGKTFEMIAFGLCPGVEMVGYLFIVAHCFLAINTFDFALVSLFIAFLLCFIFGLSKAVESIKSSVHLFLKGNLSANSSHLPFERVPKATRTPQVLSAPVLADRQNDFFAHRWSSSLVCFDILKFCICSLEFLAECSFYTSPLFSLQSADFYTIFSNRKDWLNLFLLGNNQSTTSVLCLFPLFCLKNKQFVFLLSKLYSSTFSLLPMALLSQYHRSFLGYII